VDLPVLVCSLSKKLLRSDSNMSLVFTMYLLVMGQFCSPQFSNTFLNCFVVGMTIVFCICLASSARFFLLVLQPSTLSLPVSMSSVGCFLLIL